MEEEEEEYDRCDITDPRCCLDNTLLHLADGILLSLIAAMTGKPWQQRRGGVG